MAIKTGDNFLYRGKKPLDSRDSFDTILAMTTFAESSIDEGHISYVKETDKYYKFNSTNDVDTTLGKWREYNGGGGSSTDEKVKLDANATDAKYLNELIDNSTIEVDATNNCLVVKKIDGQTATVAEINFLTGVTSNIQAQIDNLGKSMTMYGVFGTKADLLASTTPIPVDGNTAIVIADEDNNDKQMTYIYIASNSAWAQVAESSVTVRDFTTEPIDLATETTGTLHKSKIDTAIARLADVLDKKTYRGTGDGIVKQADKLTGLTATIAALNQAATDSHTHSNKAVLDKIVSNGIGSGFLADNGKYISILHVGNTSPTYDSQIWIDNTDSSKPILKIFDGTDWIAISSASSGGASTADNVEYTNADYSSYTNVQLALDALFSKVYYVKPTCSLSASKAGGTFEMGTTITAPITFTWTTNKAITSQTLTGCTLTDASVRTAIYNTNVTSDKTFTLSVSDGENSASSSVSYKFLNKVYYGSASEPDSYDSAFILGLSNNKFATSIKGSYPITVESGQFGYIACPKSFNAPSECYIGGFLTTLENAGEISFTNASGGVATYTILRTGKSGLGSLTMEFK